jgi:hypothetical protein
MTVERVRRGAGASLERVRKTYLRDTFSSTNYIYFFFLYEKQGVLFASSVSNEIVTYLNLKEGIFFFFFKEA